MADNTGRPLIFKTPEEMQKKIDEYFTACRGVPYTEEDGTPITNKWGMVIYKVAPKPPTITGLALAIGLNSRQALLNYEARDAFNDTVTRAKAFVEEYAEMRLFDKDGANGAKFALANNFKKWGEKPDGAEIKNDIVIKVELTDE